jgi:hypothetical protein
LLRDDPQAIVGDFFDRRAVFCDKYRRVDAERAISTPADADQWLHGW